LVEIIARKFDSGRVNQDHFALAGDRLLVAQLTGTARHHARWRDLTSDSPPTQTPQRLLPADIQALGADLPVTHVGALADPLAARLAVGPALSACWRALCHIGTQVHRHVGYLVRLCGILSDKARNKASRRDKEGQPGEHKR
jgi:hypothetical protein